MKCLWKRKLILYICQILHIAYIKSLNGLNTFGTYTTFCSLNLLKKNYCKLIKEFVAERDDVNFETQCGVIIIFLFWNIFVFLWNLFFDTSLFVVVST